jgi:hypothetical protein
VCGQLIIVLHCPFRALELLEWLCLNDHHSANTVHSVFRATAHPLTEKLFDLCEP